MRSLHKVLKLKADVRATARARLYTGSKNENQKVPKEKLAGDPDPSSASRPSFVNSFISSLSCNASSGAALYAKHGKDTGLTASEPLSRAVVTTSAHRRLRQSSQPLIDSNDPNWLNGFSLKVLFVNSGGRKQGGFGKATKESNSADGLSPKELVRNSGNALTSLPREGWKERRWKALGAAGVEEPLTRLSFAELKKNYVERREERIEHSEVVARIGALRSEESVHNIAARDVFQESLLTEKIETTGKVNGQNRRKHAGKAGVSVARGLQPLRNRLDPFDNSHENKIVSRVRGFGIRALHDMSLAGEGATLDRPSSNDRQSDQSASDGKSLKLLSGACNLPHPDKEKTGGEDAYFICSDKQVVGVADGVGGWADLGIDAGEYARELMSQALIAVHQEPPACIDPARVMQKAHSLTTCRGSSTACILALTDSALEAASLGDSGFVIVRNSRTVFKSPVQQHQFNIPFQLEYGGSDPPSAAQVFSLQVSVGDVIVSGTDGLFDNLYDSELTTVVVQSVRGGMAPQKTAQKIAALAQSRAQEKNRRTPFSTAAEDAGYRFYGGKMDDITVIVSYITSSNSAKSKL